MIDEQTLIAFADGELSEIERARVERALAADPVLRAQLEAHRRLRERLSAHYAPVADEPVPERLRVLLDSKVVPLRRAAPRWSWHQAAAMAATLVLGLLIGRIALPGGPIAVEDGALVARGELAEALDTRLASAQPDDAAVRIGISFAGPEGRLCRTFSAPAASGLACRAGTDWRLVMTAPGARDAAGEYRQAGSGDALVMEAAEALMTGDPFDAEAERRARDAGWD